MEWTQGCNDKKLPMRKLWFVLILFYLPIYSQSDSVPLRFQKITIEDGLPHNYLRTITQDKKGFIWIGTNYGLARYDANDFKIFLPDPKNPYSIAQKSIDNIFADSKDKLWISFSSGGICKMDLTTERFTYYSSDASNKYQTGNYYTIFLEDNDSCLWAGTNNGIFFYNKQQDKFIYAFSKNNFKNSNNRINSFTDDGIGNIWFVRDARIWKIDKKSYEISSLGEIVSNSRLDEIDFYKVYSKEKGKVWLTTYRNGLLCCDVRTKKIEYFLENTTNLETVFIDRKGNLYAIPNNPITKLFVCKKENIGKNQFESYTFFGKERFDERVYAYDDNFGNVFISSPAGFIKFNFEFGVKHILANSFIPNSISDNQIVNLFIDRTDNLWICPYRKGINKADLRQKPFRLYLPGINNLEDIQKDKNVTSVFIDSKGYTWTGNSNGSITIFDKNNGSDYHFSINSISPITSIYEDFEGFIYLGSTSEGLFKVERPDLNKIKTNSELTFSKIIRYNIISAKKIVSDIDNNLWFASANGLVEMNRASNEIINYSIQYDSLNNISDFYRTVFIDKNQTIWTGSNSGGLTKFDKSKKNFKHYLHNPQNNQSISNNTVYSIYEDKAGYLWIGTRQGLEKFNPKTEIFEHAGIGDELYNRSIFSIFPDSLGCLWMSSDIGIIKYNLSTMNCSFYGRADGMQNNEINTSASYLSKSGEIYYGGIDGLISFFPSDIKLNSVYSIPAITNFRVSNIVISPGDTLNGRVLINKQVWEANKLELFYYENDFTIEFSALHYSAPQKVKYQYKLEGFSSDWVYTDAERRYATYTGLPPGDYTFILKATNNDGLMCRPQDIVRLSIKIIPPFWQTLWFKIIIIFLIIGGAVLFYKKRLSLLERQKRLLEDKVKERTAMLENANTLLEERQEQILQQNEEIKQQKEILEETNAQLEERHEEVLQQNEEITRQKEIEEEQHAEIEKAYHELSLYEKQLEEIVESRTKDLVVAKQKAEESDKLKSSFLANLSHEIRTPLNAIVGFSGLLVDGETENDKQEMFKSMIQSSSDTLLNLIDDILDFSKIEAGQINIIKAPVYLSKIFSEIKELYTIELQKLKAKSNKEIEFRLNNSIELNEIIIFTDENRLKQIIQNLINNAIKFTSKGFVELGFNLINNKQFIEFYVKDTGIGISKQNQAFIFGRFRKIENLSGNLFRGTGLGLSICKHLVKLLGGQIGVESELGHGSIFHFTIPLQDEKKSVEINVAQHNQIEIPDFSNKTILLAEDDDSNYMLVEIYLKKTKMTIIRAINGLEAVEIFKENPNIDLLLLDIKMPIMDGFEALRQIRSINNSSIIIAQTAHAYQDEIDRIKSSGFNDYILKPINAKKLFAILQKYLG